MGGLGSPGRAAGGPGLGRLLDSLARVQHCKADDLVTFVTNNHVIIGHLAVGRVAGFLIVHVQRVGFGIVREPDSMLRRPVHSRNQPQIFLNVC